MRMVVVSNLFSPYELGGYEILCRQVCQEFVALGHEVTVLTSRGDGPKEDSLGALRIERALELTEPFDRPPTRRSRRAPRVSRRNRQVTRALLERLEPDVVFFWSLRRLTLGPAMAAVELGTPHLYTLNDAWPRAYAPRELAHSPRALLGALLDRTLWRGCTTLALPASPSVVISESLRDELVGLSAFDRAQVLYQGVQVERFESIARARRSGPCRLLYVGQLHRYKGPHVAIAALEELARRRPDLAPTLTIVGDGDEGYRDALYAQAAPLDGRVILRGRLPHDAMPELYAQHDVLLFTSLWDEPFGLTHLEAMASGLAVIATPLGGTAELMRAGKGMLSVAPGNPAELAARIALLQDDEALRARLGEEGKALVAARYGLSRYAADLLQLLERQMGSVQAQEVAA